MLPGGATLALQPGFGPTYWNLGLVLEDQGCFAEAYHCYCRGEEMGCVMPRWTAGDWRVIRRRVDLEARLEGIRRGDALPGRAAEIVELAEICRIKDLSATEAPLYSQALAMDSSLPRNLRAEHRFRAAVAATRAGCGEGRDAADLDEAGRARWRDQARRWLEEELAEWQERIEKGRPDARRARPGLAKWMKEPGLACVREKSSREKLPAGEREAWRSLWESVARLLERLE